MGKTSSLFLDQFIISDFPGREDPGVGACPVWWQRWGLPCSFQEVVSTKQQSWFPVASIQEEWESCLLYFKLTPSSPFWVSQKPPLD